MFAEILPVSLEDKREVIGYIRQNLIPNLARTDYSSEQVLLILHRLGTWRVRPAIVETQVVIDGYSAFFAGVNPVPSDRLTLEKILTELHVKGSDRFTPYGNYLRGGYRILGCFAPNPEIAQYVPEAAEYFTGAIPLSTKDYQSPESPTYYPPIFNIHKLMATICNTFDGRFESAIKEEKMAKAIADFYFWGLVMVHPFLGGNHRAYDRFIEYGFLKQGLCIETPLNETLNIPNSDPFNQALYSERRRLLVEAGLANQEFNLGRWKDMDKYLTYQHQLNDLLERCLIDDCVDTEPAALALLAWR